MICFVGKNLAEDFTHSCKRLNMDNCYRILWIMSLTFTLRVIRYINAAQILIALTSNSYEKFYIVNYFLVKVIFYLRALYFEFE